MNYKYRQRVIIEDAEGNEVVRWACGNTPAEFQEAIIQIYLECGRVSPASSTTQPKGVPFDDYAAEWFKTYKEPKLPTRTLLAARSRFNKHVIGAFPGKNIGDITSKEVQDVLNSKSNYSKAYMRDIMCYMSNVFASALEDGIISKNPMDSQKIFNPCTKVTERKALTPAEKADIIRNIPNLKQRNDRMFVGFLMFGCLRPGEIYALRWEDIDVENMLIHIRRSSRFASNKFLLGGTKTRSGVRDIPLNPRLLELLLPLGESGFVFTRTDPKHAGEPYSEQTHKRAWERIKKTIDMHGMIPYEARHTYATELAASGVPMKTSIFIMGHADERMLMRTYAHTQPEHIDAASEIMEAYYDGLAGGL